MPGLRLPARSQYILIWGRFDQVDLGERSSNFIDPGYANGGEPELERRVDVQLVVIEEQDAPAWATEHTRDVLECVLVGLQHAHLEREERMVEQADQRPRLSTLPVQGVGIAEAADWHTALDLADEILGSRKDPSGPRPELVEVGRRTHS